MELVEEAKPGEDGERSAVPVDLVLEDVTAIFFLRDSNWKRRCCF